MTAASLIPGLDTFADLAAIPVDISRGDFTSAGLDALGVIPVLGEIADTAKIARVADNVADVSKNLKKGREINKQKRGTPRNNKAQNR